MEVDLRVNGRLGVDYLIDYSSRQLIEFAT
jgi:hypothetical protein